MRRALPLLMAFVVGAVVFLTLRAQVAPSVPVKALWSRTAAWRGRRLKTEGVLRLYEEGRPSEYYAIEGDDRYRIGLQGASGAELKPLVGRRLKVEGVFSFAEGSGMYLTLQRLRPVR